MARSAACFNTQFTTLDWVTSYFYNFMVWLTIAWVYAKMHPVLREALLCAGKDHSAHFGLSFDGVECPVELLQESSRQPRIAAGTTEFEQEGRLAPAGVDRSVQCSIRPAAAGAQRVAG